MQHPNVHDSAAYSLAGMFPYTGDTINKHQIPANRTKCPADIARKPSRFLLLHKSTDSSSAYIRFSVNLDAIKETAMPYIYSKVDDLEKSKMVGSHQCVALLQEYAGAPVTLAWKQGDEVMGNPKLKKGTAIATFVDGKYPNNRHGNHAALFIKQGTNGIYVMDQWKGKSGGLVESRFIRARGKTKNGKFASPCDNADAFFVIE